MGATYVALDLETTGLDLENDEIIEIGAVQFGADGVLDRFQALVNPGRPISPPVVELTGITDEAVRSAPPIWSVAPALEDFVGDSPIVGQNVLGFDIQFLRRAGVRHSENVYDTHLLAEMLLPGLADYGLAALCERFGIAQDVRHRALADAEAAQQLFIALRRRCAALAPEVLGQADQWLALTAWPSRGFFREISEEAVVRTPGTLSGRRQSTRPPEPLSPKGKPVAVAEEHVLSTLRLAGDHPEAFPAFDRRVVQETMTMAVARALNAEQRLMVEAGTGTGKSLAYLIPAACHAVANDDRVVVSTATINLQE
ncbi:MAG: DNA polymerase III subunit epsilon, partial [Chloroflexi bacterium]